MTGERVGLRESARPTWLKLVAALDELAGLGIRTPCDEDPATWTSDDVGVRLLAAKACGPCPVRTRCAAFADANRERAHVWGGRDRTWGSLTELARRRSRQSGEDLALEVGA